MRIAVVSVQLCCRRPNTAESPPRRRTRANPSRDCEGAAGVAVVRADDSRAATPLQSRLGLTAHFRVRGNAHVHHLPNPPLPACGAHRGRRYLPRVRRRSAGRRANGVLGQRSDSARRLVGAGRPLPGGEPGWLAAPLREGLRSGEASGEGRRRAGARFSRERAAASRGAVDAVGGGRPTATARSSLFPPTCFRVRTKRLRTTVPAATQRGASRQR